MVTNKPGYLSQYYLSQRAAIIKQLGGHCSCCGTGFDLEIHHIVPCRMGRGRGNMARLTEWKRNLNNLALLCTDCHAKAHLYHFGDD